MKKENKSLQEHTETLDEQNATLTRKVENLKKEVGYFQKSSAMTYEKIGPTKKLKIITPQAKETEKPTPGPSLSSVPVKEGKTHNKAQYNLPDETMILPLSKAPQEKGLEQKLVNREETLKLLQMEEEQLQEMIENGELIVCRLEGDNEMFDYEKIMKLRN